MDTCGYLFRPKATLSLGLVIRIFKAKIPYTGPRTHVQVHSDLTVTVPLHSQND